MAAERIGPKMTQIIQVQLRNDRRDPHGERRGIKGLSILEEMKNMTPEERERQESEYWARIWEKSLDPPQVIFLFSLILASPIDHDRGS